MNGYLHILVTLALRRKRGALAQVGRAFLAPRGAEGHCELKDIKEDHSPNSFFPDFLQSSLILASRDSFHSSGIKVFFLFDSQM